VPCAAHPCGSRGALFFFSSPGNDVMW
jgi:hypothetical protein